MVKGIVSWRTPYFRGGGLKMEIERATISDAEEILSLQKLAYISEAEIYAGFNIPPLVQTLEELKDDFKNQLFLKVVIDSRTIGSVRAFAKEGNCFIGRLIVHPDFQKGNKSTCIFRPKTTTHSNLIRPPISN
jgi:hypothetical protein